MGRLQNRLGLGICLLLVSLVHTGCYPWPTVRTYASILEFRLLVDGAPASGVEVVREVTFSYQPDVFLQKAKTDGFGKILFAPVEQKALIQSIGEFNIWHLYRVTIDGHEYEIGPILKTTFFPLSERVRYTSFPSGISELRFLDNRLLMVVSLPIEQ